MIKNPEGSMSLRGFLFISPNPKEIIYTQISINNLHTKNCTPIFFNKLHTPLPLPSEIIGKSR